MRQLYTAQFGGTSAAAPIVAGVCAAYVSAVHEQSGVIPTPAQVRAALRASGTPPSDGSRIGNLPDLKRMLAAAGLPDGLALNADPTLSGALPVEIRGPASGAYVLLAARARGHTVVGLNRPLLLGAGLFAFETGAIGAGGLTARQFPVPNDRSLLGGSLYLQSVDVSTAGAAHLSSSVEAIIVH